MKITQLTSSLANGGAENLLKDYALVMKQKGYDVDVVVAGEYKRNNFLHDELKANDINIEYLGTKKYIIINWLRYLKKRKPDVIHGHLGICLFFLMVNKKTKLFYTIHSDITRLINLWGQKWKYLMNLCIKLKKMNIIVLSEKMEYDAKKVFKTERVKYLENCININEYKNVVCDKERFSREFQIPKNAFIVGHIGRFVDAKNHKKVISIFEEVLKNRENSYLLLIGSGELKNEIYKLVKNRNILNHARFLDVRKDVPQLLKYMDVFILPSKYEGFPISVIESQAAGTKTVVSKATPYEANRSPYFYMLDINESDAMWADYILNNREENTDYLDLSECDVNNVVDKLCSLYRKGVF